MTERKETDPAARISVEWGYEDHTLTVNHRDWNRLLSGESLEIKGEIYFYDGDGFLEHWRFGGGMDGSLKVEYEDESGEFGVGWEGKLSGAEIEILD